MCMWVCVCRWDVVGIGRDLGREWVLGALGLGFLHGGILMLILLLSLLWMLLVAIVFDPIHDLEQSIDREC